MIDTSKRPEKGTWKYKFCEWFVNNMNWCEGEYYDGKEKPVNKVYEFFYRYWLWPFYQNDCTCCNTVRGLIYGFIIGLTVGVILC